MKNNNIIPLQQKSKSPKPTELHGKWDDYAGLFRRVWRCGCGSTIMQVIEGSGCECVVCKTVIIPL